MRTCSAGDHPIASPCPSPPACGGRGRGPAPRRREGEVGGAAGSEQGLPPPPPPPPPPPADPLRPWGGEGDFVCQMYACPAAPTAARGRRIVNSVNLPTRLST